MHDVLSRITRALLAVSLLVAASPICHGTTTITNTRAEVSLMATLWEADSLQISGLANAQYPQFSNDWQYIFPHSNISADGDVHMDMAVSSSGYGSTNNNIGESPIIVEVINATSAQQATRRAGEGRRLRIIGCSLSCGDAIAVMLRSGRPRCHGAGRQIHGGFPPGC